ncbi:Hsp20 family protein, partial [Streptococcus thermophilus]
QYLLENVKEDEIKASYSDGVLKVTLFIGAFFCKNKLFFLSPFTI